VKNKILSVIITILISLSLVTLRASTLPVLAQGGNTDFLNNCSTDSIDPNCTPPTLQQFELLVVKLIYSAWSLGSILWLVYFINIARLYYTSDPNKIEEAKQRFLRWLTGIALFYLSWAIIGNVMGIMIADGTDCFEEFNGTPGFMFFFGDVCES